jgi:hypothetical protein
MEKSIITILALTISILCCYSKENLIAYWPFDDGTARDVSGNGYHGVLMNSPELVDGKYGKAFRFRGFGENTDQGSHIVLPMIDFNAYSAFTISMWVYEEGWSYWHGDSFVFFGDWTYGWLGIFNHFSHDDNRREFGYSVGSVMHDTQIDAYKEESEFRNRWVHLVMSYDNGLVKAYFNGELIGEQYQQINIHGGNAAIARSWWDDGATTSTRFNGIIDDVKIYAEAKTPDEVLDDDVPRCNEETQLIAYWSFDDGTADDFSGNDYHGTKMNSPTPAPGVNGKGQSMYFEGRGADTDQGDHILLPRIKLENLDEFTVTMWVKEIEVTHYQGEEFFYFGKFGYSWLGIGHAAPGPQNDTKLQFSVGSSDEIYDPITEFYQDRGSWAFYSMTYNNGIMKGYRNGELVGTKNQNINIYGDYAALGRHWWGNRTSSRFTGYMDEVKIWCKALSDEEIEDEYDGCPDYDVSILSEKLMFCDGDSLELSCDGDYESYLWSTGETTKSIWVSEEGDYTLEVVDADDCLGETFVSVSKKIVDIDILSEATAICNGDSLELMASDDFDKYLWSTGETGKSIFVKDPGNYSLEVVDEDSCSAVASLDVFVSNIDVSISSDGLDFCLGDSLELICEGDFVSGVWSTGESGPSIFAKEGGEYFVVAQNDFGCIDTAFITVTANTTDVEIYSDGLSFCEGDSLELSADADFESYEWSSGETTKSIFAKDEGEYRLKVVSGSDCPGYASVYLSKYLASIEIIPETTDMCEGDSVRLSLDGRYAQCLWSTGDDSDFIIVNEPGDYYVSIVDEFGCKGYDTVSIRGVSGEVEIIEEYYGRCEGDSVKLSADKDFAAYSWTGGATSKSVVVSSSGKYLLSVVDEYGCAYSDSVNVDFSGGNRLKILNLLADNECLFDTTYLSKLHCEKIKIVNISEEDYLCTASSLWLIKNTEFSIPQSQLPVIFVAGDTTEIVVCLTTFTAGSNRDTLIIEDYCDEIYLPLKAIGMPDLYGGLSQCETPLNLTSRGFLAAGAFNAAQPYPNPAQNKLFAPYSISRQPDTLPEPRGELIDIFGTSTKNRGLSKKIL